MEAAEIRKGAKRMSEDKEKELEKRIEDLEEIALSIGKHISGRECTITESSWYIRLLLTDPEIARHLKNWEQG